MSDVRACGPDEDGSHLHWYPLGAQTGDRCLCGKRTMSQNRVEADAGVIFGEDGEHVVDPDGRVIQLVRKQNHGD